MSITYTWELTSLKKQTINSNEDVIIQTYWKKIGTNEDGIQGIFNGATPFNPESINFDNFTSYADLTKEQVLGWIQAIAVNEYEEHINSRIEKQINDKINAVETVDNPFE
jgi:hypothetical protein